MTTAKSLVEKIKQATNYQTNKQIYKEKVESDLHITYSSGMFKVTPELISFLTAWPEEELFLEDIYGNPIAVLRTQLLEKAISHYHMVMNKWYNDHKEIQRARKI